MTTAVHGKASLADLLRSDAAHTGKNADDDRDKTNTVDFGATLMALVDQPASLRNKAADSDDISVSGAPATPAEVKRSGPGPEVVTEPGSGQLDKLPSKSAAGANWTSSRLEILSPPEHSGHATISGDIFGGFHDARMSLPDSTVASHRSDPTSLVHGPILDAACRSHPDLTAASTDAADSKFAPQSVFRPANAKVQVAPTIDSSVPDVDARLEMRKQTFPASALEDDPPTPSREFSPVRSFAKVANSTQVEATPSGAAKASTVHDGSIHSRVGRASDGTSPALSSQPVHRDEMNLHDAKLSQPASATTAGNTNEPGGQLLLQNSFDAIASTTPQSQRIRMNPKNPGRQPSDAPGLAFDASSRVDAKPVARSQEVTGIRMTTEASAPREPAHAVSLTVHLADGQTAQASVRERAGAVDVKILTPTAASAERVSSEMNGMRQNLDAAGIRLGHSEVSYQGGDGGHHGHRDGYRPPTENPSGGKDVFIMSEVVE